MLISLPNVLADGDVPSPRYLSRCSLLWARFLPRHFARLGERWRIEHLLHSAASFALKCAL